VIISIEDIPGIVTRRDGRAYVVSNASRVGVAALYAAIEWYWYSPATSRNRFYDIYGTDWRGMSWVIVAFPQGRLDAVRRLAKQIGLRVVDGSPVMIGRDHSSLLIQVTSRPSQLSDFIKRDDVPIEFFPGTILPNGLDNLSIFTIENDENSPVYKNRQHDDEAMLQATIEINDILNKGVKLTPAQIADYIYGSGSFPNV
jgi:hypothetical protein